jgi:hypothetical protein
VPKDFDEALGHVNDDMGILLLLPEFRPDGTRLGWLNEEGPGVRTPFADPKKGTDDRQSYFDLFEFWL